ncbi:hypothetical protein MNBD_GAMMA07-922 [hydrothermal vent metagenome]|uniref:DUF58 domain-containing protein n=1 Tax=hydrothermal vent metagenome TaxID=652676 RepID=A0A3B0XGX0_9ZZZZ
MKHLPTTHKPILTTAEIDECIQQGNQWTGSLFKADITRKITQGQSGDFEAQQQGSGIDYSETRPYQPGDEPRHINWRATARTGRPQVRVFHKDVSPSAYFLIDRRATMRFGTRSRLKVSQATRLATFLASAEAQKGLGAGGLILNETPQWLPALGGQQGVAQLAQFASQACTPLNGESNFSFKRALALLIEQMSQQSSATGSRIFLLSDFYDLHDNMLSQLYQLSHQHHVCAIELYDSAEQQLPKAGMLQLLWGNINNIVDTQNTVTINEYKQRFESKQRHIKILFEKANINFISMSSQVEDIAVEFNKRSS